MTAGTVFANPLLEPVSRPPPQRVAVIGAGTIGPDIGYYLKSALPSIELVLIDLQQSAIDAALARLKGYAYKAVAKGKMAAQQADAVLTGLSGSTGYAALAGADWVIEAATEDLPLKRRIFAAVEAQVSPDAAITSNTSSLPAARLFAEMAHPERATVTHFFAPAWRNPVVEVIDWPRADRALLAWLRRLFAATGKLPLTTSDAPCFMLDRVFDNWCNEAALLLPQASAAQVDTVAMRHVHAGPFFVLNLAHGNPIIVETNTLQAAEEGAHYEPASIFGSVERWLTVSPGQTVDVPETTAATIDDRLRGVWWSQAVDIVDRGIGAPADLDIGCRLALGFRHGPFEAMHDAGNAEVTRVLQRFAAERPGMPTPQRTLASYQPVERHVVVDRADNVVVITLRRPEALNALHDALTDEILAVVRRFEADDSVAGFVVTGWGTKAFCAGGDIGRFPAMLGDAPAAVQYARHCSRLLVHLDACAKPVVAAIHGMALGGGFELAMRCHALVADRDAWFQLPEVTLGILPAIGALAVPQRRWPAAAPTFHRMLTRGDKLRAPEALALGVLDAVADDAGAVLGLACAKVRELAARGVPALRDAPPALPELPVPDARDGKRPLSAEVVALIDRAVRDAARAPTLAQALAVGYAAFGEVACTAAAREGITAFVERRPPDFSATP